MGRDSDPEYLKQGGLNEVRPGRPEQYVIFKEKLAEERNVSMKSGLEDRNNLWGIIPATTAGWLWVSMKSGLEDRNN